MPPAIPVTIPVLPTVAMPVLLLLHVPPTVASLSVVVDPAQTLNVPVIDATAVFTVIIFVAVPQPVINV